VFKNVASQKWVVFAFDETDNTAKTGDADQITANLRIDGAAANTVDDEHPTELEDGYYIFDITDAESNGNNIVICPNSDTANIQVIGCPAAVYTRPPYFNSLGIESDGDIGSVRTIVSGVTIEGTISDLDTLQNASVTDVWAYSTGVRSLTGGVTLTSGVTINGTITDLDGLENASATDIWTYTTGPRKLVGGVTIEGTISDLDGLNNTSDADVWTYTSRALTTGTTNIGGVSVTNITSGVTIPSGVTVTSITDKTGYNLSNNQTGVAIGVVSSGVSITNNDDKAGYSLYSDQSAVTIGHVAGGVTIEGTISDLDGLENSSVTEIWTYTSRALTTGTTNIGGVSVTNITSGVTIPSGVTVTSITDKTGYNLSNNQTGVAIGVVSSGVSITNNDDKTGYSISGTSTTLDDLNDISAIDVWSTTEKQQIRDALGLTGTTTATTGLV